MSSEFGDRRAARVGGGAPEPENVPCPRCESTNTKFCYYNNYNLSQPRYFCKSCRRYWTRGGTLRNIPVGGGTRRNTKRSRPAAHSGAAAASDTQDPLPTLPSNNIADGMTNTTSLRSPVLESSASSAPPGNYDMGSLLSSQHGGAFLGLGGYGLGSGLEGLAFGSARAEWPVMDGAGAGGETAPMCDTWQMRDGSGGITDGGDCYGWPDLAMSMPGTLE